MKHSYMALMLRLDDYSLNGRDNLDIFGSDSLIKMLNKKKKKIYFFNNLCLIN